ncbi:MAG: GtrA family protein [Parcubacteria group bacterium]|nr:GtrA family protein [Parcubacteria group bacterium]
MKRIFCFFVQHKVVRYLISGGTAAFVSLSSLFILTEIAGVWYLASSILSFIAGFIVSFTLQKFWTFEDTRREVVGRQLILYLVATGSALGVNTALLYVAVDVFGLWYMLAQFLISGIIAVGSFFVYNMLIFQKKDRRKEAAKEMNTPLGILLPRRAVSGLAFRAYIGTPLQETRPLLILKQHLGLPDYKGQKPFRTVYGHMDFSFLEMVREPANADFFLLPHSYFSARAVARDYVENFIRLAEKHGKKVVLFSEGDTDESIAIPHAVVFRTSQYAHKKQRNEIIMPPQVYAEDVLCESAFSLRAKRAKPVVSFCGWSEMGTLKQKTKFFLRNAYADARMFLGDPHAEASKQGIYFRKRAMHFLEKSPLVETSFLKRDFFSVNKHTIKLPREVLRSQYIENIAHSDFVLAPKGDGNFSIRFYEALALGRIPVLIDTESILPLEAEIPYNEYIVRVPHQKISFIGAYIAHYYNQHTEASYADIQRRARALFLEKLRVDMFLKNALTKLAGRS